MASVPATQYYAIEVPAVVKNGTKLIKMFGGSEEMINAFDCEKRRLKFSFRPQMVYAKPAYADACSVSGILIRVGCYKNRKSGEIKLVTHVLGHVTRMYKFQGMADFQYGPFERVKPPNATGETSSSSDGGRDVKHRVFYKDLILSEPLTVLDSYLSRNVPVYLPPLLFSRQDTPVKYNFSSRFRSSEYIEREEKDNRCQVARKPRANFGSIVGFLDPTPLSSHPMATKRILARGIAGQQVFEELIELFEKRPLWLRSNLFQQIKSYVNGSGLRAGILSVAYYMTGGPWSRTWVRFGYDPRQDPDARHFQVIDFRIRSHILIRKILERNPHRPYVSILTNRRRSSRTRTPREDGSMLWSDPQLTTKSVESREESADQPSEERDTEGDVVDPMVDGDETEEQFQEFRFSRNHLPRSQQVMCCLRDVDIPEVQQILADKPTRTKCDPNDGWLNPGALVRIRLLMTKYLEIWMADEQSTSKADNV